MISIVFMKDSGSGPKQMELVLSKGVNFLVKDACLYVFSGEGKRIAVFNSWLHAVEGKINYEVS